MRRNLTRLIFGVAAAYFLARGPWRAIHDSRDLLTVFAAARCWLQGTDPYSVPDLVAAMKSAGADAPKEQLVLTPSIYLPTAMLLFAPLALLPWALAKALWLLGNLVAAWWTGHRIFSQTNGWLRGSRIHYWSFLLAFAPLHTAIARGQPSIVVCALAAAGLSATQPVTSGILLGLAVCIKPQLAIGLLLLPLITRRYRTVVTAAAVGLLISAVSLAILKTGALSSLANNLLAVSGPGGAYDGSFLNPYRYQLIDIHSLIPAGLYAMPVLVLAWTAVGLVSAIALARTRDSRLTLAVIATGTLLFSYHRFYDAQILWLAIPALSLLPARVEFLTLAAFSVFLIPGQTIAATVPGPPVSGALGFFLLGHEALACLVIWMAFAVVAIRRGTGQLNESASPHPAVPAASGRLQSLAES